MLVGGLLLAAEKRRRSSLGSLLLKPGWPGVFGKNKVKSSVVSVTAKPPGTAPNFSRLLSRWLFLLVILVIEFIGITYQFEAPTVADDASWSARLFSNSSQIWRIAIGFISVFLISFIPHVSRVKNFISELQEQSTGYRWWLWLTGHFLALAAFIFITSLVFEKPTDPAHTLRWADLGCRLVRAGKRNLPAMAARRRPKPFLVAAGSRRAPGIAHGATAGSTCWVAAHWGGGVARAGRTLDISRRADPAARPYAARLGSIPTSSISQRIS